MTFNQLHSYTENTLDSININPLIRNNQDTSKATFGLVGVIGGSDGMFGSLFLVGRAAMLTGSGKVVIGFNSDQYPIIDYHMPELIVSPADKILKNTVNYDVIVIGPGLGTEEKSIKLLSELIQLKPKCKLIFDADALNLIAVNREIAKEFYTLEDKVITPHQMEASRLLNIPVNTICGENRINIALELQKKYNSIVLLKGLGSVIVDINGTAYVNKTGSSALSNAGQGDSLCGIIASFVAQGMDLFSAVRFAVYIHGRASDDLVKAYGGYNGLIATDTTTNVRKVLNKILYS
ncbi:MAG: NAD(P)H-hydrate dehydratase [Neisseriaceae bacterium]